MKCSTLFSNIRMRYMKEWKKEIKKYFRRDSRQWWRFFWNKVKAEPAGTYWRWEGFKGRETDGKYVGTKERSYFCSVITTRMEREVKKEILCKEWQRCQSRITYEGRSEHEWRKNLRTFWYSVGTFGVGWKKERKEKWQCCKLVVGWWWYG